MHRARRITCVWQQCRIVGGGVEGAKGFSSESAGRVELAMLATGHGLGLCRAGQTSEAKVSPGTSTYRSSAQRISGAKRRPLFHLLPCEGPHQVSGWNKTKSRIQFKFPTVFSSLTPSMLQRWRNTRRERVKFFEGHLPPSSCLLLESHTVGCRNPSLGESVLQGRLSCQRAVCHCRARYERIP